MEFEKSMRQASEVLTFEDRFMDPKQPQGLWFCDSAEDVRLIGVNAVCLNLLSDWDDLPKCRPFIAHFPYIVIVAPNSIARERLVEEIRPRLPATTIYVVDDTGFRKCSSVKAYLDTYGIGEILSILDGSRELPAYGLLNLADVSAMDMSKVPHTLSRFPVLDRGIGGFYAGELSVWTGKRGIGKSTILSQILLEAIDQRHTVCAYSGELSKEKFRDWTYLQAAGPDHIVYREDKSTGKRLAAADGLADKQISEWIDQRFWLFDLDLNTQHSPKTILDQFSYCHMRYGADVFLVDNIMSLDLDISRSLDFNRAQSEFTRQMAQFAKRNHVHVHLVVHPRKSTSEESYKVTADDVSGSGDITNRADNVFFLTTHMAQKTEGGELEEKPLLKILKNRDFGAKGQQWLDFDKKSRRFFADRVGDPHRKYGWDPEMQQITLVEDQQAQDEANNVFQEDNHG